MTDTTDQNNCSCYTLQSAQAKPVITIYEHPVLTLGLLAMFLLVVALLVLAIYVRPKPPHME